MSSLIPNAGGTAQGQLMIHAHAWKPMWGPPGGGKAARCHPFHCTCASQIAASGKCHVPHAKLLPPHTFTNAHKKKEAELYKRK